MGGWQPLLPGDPQCHPAGFGVTDPWLSKKTPFPGTARGLSVLTTQMWGFSTVFSLPGKRNTALMHNNLVQVPVHPEGFSTVLHLPEDLPGSSTRNAKETGRNASRRPQTTRKWISLGEKEILNPEVPGLENHWSQQPGSQLPLARGSHQAPCQINDWEHPHSAQLQVYQEEGMSGADRNQELCI